MRRTVGITEHEELTQRKLKTADRVLRVQPDVRVLFRTLSNLESHNLADTKILLHLSSQGSSLSTSPLLPIFHNCLESRSEDAYPHMLRKATWLVSD